MKKNKLFLLLSILYLFLGTTPLVQATTVEEQEPSVNEITENLKNRLKETLEEASSSSDNKEEVSVFKSFVGQIQDVIQQTIIIKTKDGKKQITVDDTTTILRNPGNTNIKLDSIRIDDYIIAIGQPKEADVMQGRRLIVSANSLTETTKITGYGQITDLTNDTITITTQDQETTLTITKSTKIKTKDNPVLKISDLSKNQRVIYVAEKDDEESIATVLMIIK